MPEAASRLFLLLSAAVAAGALTRYLPAGGCRILTGVQP
jgi:hypothetical protein